MTEEEKKIESQKLLVMREFTREMIDLRLTMEHFTKLLGPELEKTHAIQRVAKKRAKFKEEWEDRFGTD